MFTPPFSYVSQVANFKNQRVECNEEADSFSGPRLVCLLVGTACLLTYSWLSSCLSLQRRARGLLVRRREAARLITVEFGTDQNVSVPPCPVVLSGMCARFR